MVRASSLKEVKACPVQFVLAVNDTRTLSEVLDKMVEWGVRHRKQIVVSSR